MCNDEYILTPELKQRKYPGTQLGIKCEGSAGNGANAERAPATPTAAANVIPSSPLLTSRIVLYLLVSFYFLEASRQAPAHFEVTCCRPTTLLVPVAFIAQSFLALISDQRREWSYVVTADRERQRRKI
ncbi:hypothetical protein EVAR_98373_1 [Eumeta japonica]|uniref:Uncharacterized protein n=1 Tax=Eumeta variegata TaxID=151549 RepID=A0A4C2A7C5_EUMVA|nr:hypothetical protein EVAR_98373_1 [Eumeta japonica]